MKIFKKTYTFDKSEAFILFLLIVFFSVLVFSVGVMIGKKMLENECKLMLEDLSTSLEECRSNGNKNDISLNKTNNENSINQSDNSLSDNNSLVEAKEAKVETIKNEVKNENLNKINKEKIISNPFENNDDKKNIDIINNKTNSSNLEISKVTSDIKDKYTVQISAHREEEDAISKTSELYDDGYKSAYYMKAKIEGKGIWYRVGIGFFPKKNSADLFAQMLKRQGKINSYIIRKIR